VGACGSGGGALREAVSRAIEEYNRYRVPEARAELLEIRGCEVVVRFEGSFHETCGINDWVIDLKYYLEDQGVEVEDVKIIEPEDDIFNEENWRIGVFKVKSTGKSPPSTS